MLNSLQNNGTTEHQVESFIRKKLESLLKESQIRDKEDPDSFTVRALLKATHEGLNAHLKQVYGSLLYVSFNRKKKAPRTCFLSFVICEMLSPFLPFISSYCLKNKNPLLQDDVRKS